MISNIWRYINELGLASGRRGRLWLVLPVLALVLAAIGVVAQGGDEPAPVTVMAAAQLQPPVEEIKIDTVEAAAQQPRLALPAAAAPSPAAPAPIDSPPATAAVASRGKVVVIDPGHAARSDPGQEPIGPGSAKLKIKDPGGATGVVSGVREAVVTLAIAQYLRQLLEQEGYTVVMTREGAEYSGGNRERAAVANQTGAALMVRIHCDGAGNPAASGASTLYPAAVAGWTDDIHAASKRAAGLVQAALVRRLGVADRGTVERSDITGFNWSDTPVILTEVGFMSNPEEDRQLNTPAYQMEVAGALFEGIKEYLGTD